MEEEYEKKMNCCEQCAFALCITYIFIKVYFDT